jgi:hypothetical protein
MTTRITIQIDHLANPGTKVAVFEHLTGAGRPVSNKVATLSEGETYETHIHSHKSVSVAEVA